jgi:spermidine synthase
MHRLSAALLLALTLTGCATGHPRVVNESSAMFGRLVVTEEEPGVRSLRFAPGEATQSRIRLGHPLDLLIPYTRAAMVALSLVENPKRILVVGLGGGAMPMFLRSTCPDATIDAVEIDPAVISAARRWFGFREDARLRAWADDGRAFVEKSAARYDLVFLDAYGGSDIPRHLATLEFLEAVRERLAPGGVVVGNVWGAEANPLFGSMHETWAAAYEQLCAVNVQPGVNWILLGRRGPSASSIESELVARAPGLAARYSLPFDLGPFVEWGCMPVAASGEILRDERSAR